MHDVSNQPKRGGDRMIYTVYLTFKVGKYLVPVEVEADNPEQAIDKVLDSVSSDLTHISCEDIEAHL